MPKVNRKHWTPKPPKMPSEGACAPFVVKVQVPLFSCQRGAPALVYNEDRKVEMLIPVTPDLSRAMGDDVKAYFKAIIAPAQIEGCPGACSLQLQERVPDCDW